MAYVAPFEFPEGSAGARRVLGIARSIAETGRHVVVMAGMQDNVLVDTLDPGSQKNHLVQHVGVREYDRTWPTLRKLRAILLDDGLKSVRWLDNQVVLPEAVIVYGSSCPAILRLKSWCRAHRVPVIADVVEWYAGGHVPGGHLSPIFWGNEYAMRCLLPRSDGIIAISSYLERYYAERGCVTVRIPPTLDIETACLNRSRQAQSRRIELVYAGIPGKKDLLQNALHGLRMADPAADTFHLTILGPNHQLVRDLDGQWNQKHVTIGGWRSRGQVMEAVANADFSILLRAPERYAHAGFPTKVAESMACGTPVICNLTSDLAEHVIDMVTGVVCSGSSARQFAEALQRIAALSAVDLDAMRVATRNHAERAFDFRSYVPRLDAFLGQCLSQYDTHAAIPR